VIAPARLALVGGLLLAGGALVWMDWPATLTDEDDYMPHALADVASGRNPYSTEHRGTGTIERPWNEQTYAWTTTYPYLPALAVLQLPGVDYRVTALAAYGLLLWALRDASPRAFYAFANPLVLWLAASGFNDFVPLSLLAWAHRLRLPVLAGVAAACKQFILPLLAVEAAIARDWRRLAVPTGVALAIALPYIIWDAQAFVGSAFLQHASKVPDLYVFWNYLLYPLYLFALPPARAAPGAGEARVAA
jgi:hypothetical protein